MQAALFDMDGLLVDTEPLWTLAEHDLAAELGGVFTPAVKTRIVGTRLDVAVPIMLDAYGVPVTPARVAAASRWLLARMTRLFADPPVFLPGALALVAALREQGVPVALVSSSYRVLVDAVLAHTPDLFDVTVAGDEVSNAKPAPEPYLTAAARLGVSAQRCVVLEDSPAGAAAAEAAGCALVLAPSVVFADLTPRPRRLVVPSLREVDVAALQDLVGLGSPA
jgi:HAD superfamily hydrolase (TIGR01509 family)